MSTTAPASPFKKTGLGYAENPKGVPDVAPFVDSTDYTVFLSINKLPPGPEGAILYSLIGAAKEKLKIPYQEEKLRAIETTVTSNNKKRISDVIAATQALPSSHSMGELALVMIGGTRDTHDVMGVAWLMDLLVAHAMYPLTARSVAEYFSMRIGLDITGHNVLMLIKYLSRHVPNIVANVADWNNVGRTEWTRRYIYSTPTTRYFSKVYEALPTAFEAVLSYRDVEYVRRIPYANPSEIIGMKFTPQAYAFVYFALQSAGVPVDGWEDGAIAIDFLDLVNLFELKEAVTSAVANTPAFHPFAKLVGMTNYRNLAALIKRD